MCVSNWSMKWCFQLDSINLVLKSCGMNNNKARSNFSLYFNFAEKNSVENYRELYALTNEMKNVDISSECSFKHRHV